MPRFLTERDYRFIHTVSDELVNKVVDTSVRIYRANLAEMSDDIYGENINKTYLEPVEVKCLMNHDSPSETFSEIGVSETSKTTFALKQNIFEQLGWLPMVGDYVEWNNFYYEVINTKVNQYLQNRPGYNFTIVLDCTSTNKSFLNMASRYE